ncbi:MAG: hypothetical protein A2583_15815 [Bdellovibrionales bacterium RIFOXYD1_FULL_53_11]|nr:MAG: hypothetical protein A2583_15815 [Bdellovibrionales bacterium RIFOXYD1_FULL_53_11]
MIATERLLIRLGTTDDVPAIISFYRNNLERIARTATVPDCVFSEEFWRGQLETNRAEFEARTALRVFLFKKTDPAKIAGFLVFGRIFRGYFKYGSIGGCIDKECEGTGLMKEGLCALIGHVFDSWDVHRIQTEYLETNIRSISIALRIGFKEIGVIPEFMNIDGVWHNHVVASLSATDWKVAVKQH